MANLSSPKNAPMRSISLPSRLNLHSIKIESELNKLKTWETSLVSIETVSADIVRAGLVGLAEFYNCLEEFLHSLPTQQALSQHQNRKIIEEPLEISIGLLDSSTMTRDLISMLKDNMRNLQSVFRRKGGDLIIESGIIAYTNCKKKAKKESAKCLKALKQLENIISGSMELFNVNPYLSMVIGVLKEVALITISTLRFIFLFLSVQTTTKSSRWSLLSNLIHKNSIKTNDSILNELQSFDVAIQKSDIKFNTEDTRNRLEALDHGLEGIEDGLDCLFRCLIKNRVTLLNILVL